MKFMIILNMNLCSPIAAKSTVLGILDKMKIEKVTPILEIYGILKMM